MIILLIFTLIVSFIIYKIIAIIWSIIYKIKINNLIENIDSLKDLLYVDFKDYVNAVAEVLRRKGYKVKGTDKCGEDGNGLLLDDIQFTEIWKDGLNRLVEVETAMKLTTRMNYSNIHRGMIITLGDFKPSTKLYSHKYVIELVNGTQLLSMFKEVQRGKEVLEAN